MLIQRLEEARSSVGRGWRHGVEWEAWSRLFLQVESLLVRHGLEGVRARERERREMAMHVGSYFIKLLQMYVSWEFDRWLSGWYSRKKQIRNLKKNMRESCLDQTGLG